MGDGHLNKCKDCCKEQVKANRKKNLEYYRDYDRKRGNRQSPEYLSEYRAKYPNKARAHTIVARAIRSKQLYAEPCEVCGEKSNTHAHHDDYNKPLNVRWLCPGCHSQWHAKNGEAKNP